MPRPLAIRASAAKRPDNVAIGTPGPGCTLPPARKRPGTGVVAPERAKASLLRVGWEEARLGAKSFDEAVRLGSTFLTDDAAAAIAHPATEVVIDATGSPSAGIRHVLVRHEQAAGYADARVRAAATATAEAVQGAVK